MYQGLQQMFDCLKNFIEKSESQIKSENKAEKENLQGKKSLKNYE